MKNSYIVVILIALFFVDGWWTGILRWIIFKIISTGIVGAAFKTLVDVCAYHPEIWESSINLLSQPSNSELKFDCPPGLIAAPNHSHFPTSNGCGADGLKIDIEYLPYKDHELCCNAHDICYDKCHIIASMDVDEHRGQCDKEFKNCLIKICTLKSWQRYLICPFRIILTNKYWNENCEQPLIDDREKKCEASVEVLYESVHGWGFSAYLNAQSQACVCVPG
uniref:Uncharacterized protein n=1 Tax=Daphnia galeata TaxID=27404 RepID=A0A8J2S018_9CRUS|nr:unnamed protein product [Daphnia galeata]